MPEYAAKEIAILRIESAQEHTDLRAHLAGSEIENILDDYAFGKQRFLAGPNENIQFLLQWESIFKAGVALFGYTFVQELAKDAYKNKRAVLQTMLAGLGETSKIFTDIIPKMLAALGMNYFRLPWYRLQGIR